MGFRPKKVIPHKCERYGQAGMVNLGNRYCLPLRRKMLVPLVQPWTSHAYFLPEHSPSPSYPFHPSPAFISCGYLFKYCFAQAFLRPAYLKYYSILYYPHFVNLFSIVFLLCLLKRAFKNFIHLYLY